MAHYFDGENYVGEHMGVKYRLPRDDDAENPREAEDGWLGTMACEHGRYKLGDEGGTGLLTDAIRASAQYRDGWENDGSYGGRNPNAYVGDASEVSGIVKMLPRLRDVIYLPLYLYDHSGITMNTTGFSCRWDSGQVGFIFVTAADVFKEYADEIKHYKKPMLSVALRATVLERLKAEVSVYDHFLTGQIYSWEVGEESVSGYYGDQSAAEGAETYIESLSDEDRAALIAAQAEGDQEEADG